jgi:hypothetical protein
MDEIINDDAQRAVDFIKTIPTEIANTYKQEKDKLKDIEAPIVDSPKSVLSTF